MALAITPNVTEIFCSRFSCVGSGHVEAALQSQTDPISGYVRFLEFASVTFVMSRVERNMEILVLMSKERPAFGRGKFHSTKCAYYSPRGGLDMTTDYF